MAITTMDQIAAGLAAAPVIDLFAPSATNVAAGFVNLQRAVVTSTGQMAVPAAASAGGTLHSAGQAGFGNLPDPVGGASRYLAQSALTFATAGSLWFYDRVWSCSGFSGTLAATAQAVTSFPVLTRPDANGTGLEIWIECYTATGATASNITVQYTNSDSVAGRSTVPTAHIPSMPANRMYRVPLQAGDTGVKSIQSVTLSGTTGAGSFGVTLLRKIAVTGSAVANIPVVSDFAALGMPVIQNGTALNAIHQATTTSSGIILGVLTFIDG